MRVVIRGEPFEVEPTVTHAAWPFWDLAQAGEWEPETLKLLEETLTSSGSFVDVGAWVGPLTLFASRRCRWVYAVEPDPVARLHLRENLWLNKVKNVTVDSRAIAEYCGLANIGTISQYGDSLSSTLWAYPVKPVVCVTLETLFAEYEIADCQLLKVDVEGAEATFLPSALPFLRFLGCKVHLSLHGTLIGDADIATLRQALAPWGIKWTGDNRAVVLEPSLCR